MNQPTDKEIFAHMAPDEDPTCDKCGGEVESVEYSDYKTYKCLDCSFEPSPPEEQQSMVKIIQILVSPEDCKYQGSFLGLGDDGVVYVAANSGCWEVYQPLKFIKQQ